MWGRWYYILYLEFHKIGQRTFAQHRSWELQIFPKLHDKYVVVTTDKLLTIHMASHNIPAATTRKRTSLTMICLFCVHSELQQKHETSYIPRYYWIPNGLQLLFANYYHLFFQLSKQDFRVTVTSGTPGLVRIKRMHKITISLLIQQH